MHSHNGATAKCAASDKRAERTSSLAVLGKGQSAPGVDHAAAYACWDDRVVYAIWADFDTTGGGTSGPTMDGVYRAFLTAENGTQVECECKTNDGVSGRLTIQVDGKLTNSAPYDLETGRIFLISTQAGVSRVTQLKRDAFEAAVEGSAKEYVKARLHELAVNDSEIKGFLTEVSSGGDSLDDRALNNQ